MTLSKPSRGDLEWDTQVNLLFDRVNEFDAVDPTSLATDAELTAAVAAHAAASDPHTGYLRESQAPTVLAGVGDGVTDDTAAINAQLAALSAGASVRGVPGATYLLSAPIVLRAGGLMTLDMTGCTVTLNAGANCNMLQNSAVATSQRAVADAAMTSSSATLTSATAAFTSADVGRTVIVAGAGLGGATLVTTVSAVTDSTTATLALAASATVSGATATLYARDTRIRVIGGTWARGSVAGSNNNTHSLFFRRVDDLIIERIHYTSSAGKYMISLGDVTKYRVRDCTAAAFSDGVHIIGPATDGIVERISGTTGDDAVAVTTTDYTSYDDTHGSVASLVIRDIDATNTTRAVLLATSASGSPDGFTITNVLVDGVHQRGTGRGVKTGLSVADSASYVDNIIIRRIRGRGISLSHGTHKRVIIEDVDLTNERAVTVAPDTGLTANSVEQLTMRDLRAAGTTTAEWFYASDSDITLGTVEIESAYSTASTHGVNLSVGAATSFSLTRCTYVGAATGQHLLNVGGATALGRLLVADCRVSVLTNARLVNLVNASTAAITAAVFRGCTISSSDSSTGGDLIWKASGTAVTTMSVLDCVLTSCRGILNNSGSGATEVLLSNVRAASCNRLVQGSNDLTLIYSNVILTGQVNQPFYINSGAAATIRGFGWHGYTSGAVLRQTTESIRVVAPDLPADVSVLARNLGDRAYNTNAGLACGAGPVLSNGTSWKHLYTGTEYT